jgi:galactokinase
VAVSAQIETIRTARGVDDRSFPDADAFCDWVRHHRLFAEDAVVTVARAPGRLDVLGGIADYSGSLVLELPIAAAALVAAQVQDDGRVVAVSGSRRIELSAQELLVPSLDRLSRRLAGDDAWGAYVLGPIALLLREEGLALPGLRLLVSSSVPEGKGLGSSAAVGVATLQAAADSLGCSLPPRRIALLAQRAEQAVAGAPCGAMDQMTAVCGEAGHLLALLCRPADVMGAIALPSPLTVWGIDSGMKHAVSGAAYGRARCASFMGKALLGCDEPYLASLDPFDVDEGRLPEVLWGKEFLELRDGVDDPFSVVEPDVLYPVRAATMHPIEEQQRVQMFVDLLTEPVTPRRAQRLGELLFQSHAGYSRCGLGTARTDALAHAVRRAGWKRGLAGARISGGGSGGTVVVLGREDAEPTVRALAERLGAGLVSGSSAGAAAFGLRHLEPAPAPSG